MEAAPAPLAICDSYGGLIAALRARAAELNTPLQSIDTVAGLPDSYTAKLLTQKKRLGPISLGPLLHTGCGFTSCATTKRWAGYGTDYRHVAPLDPDSTVESRATPVRSRAPESAVHWLTRGI
jgi:hypothetical protein